MYFDPTKSAPRSLQAFKNSIIILYFLKIFKKCQSMIEFLKACKLLGALFVGSKYIIDKKFLIQRQTLALYVLQSGQLESESVFAHSPALRAWVDPDLVSLKFSVSSKDTVHIHFGEVSYQFISIFRTPLPRTSAL